MIFRAETWHALPQDVNPLTWIFLPGRIIVDGNLGERGFEQVHAGSSVAAAAWCDPQQSRRADEQPSKHFCPASNTPDPELVVATSPASTHMITGTVWAASVAANTSTCTFVSIRCNRAASLLAHLSHKE
jgi:hypothetical protein